MCHTNDSWLLPKVVTLLALDEKRVLYYQGLISILCWVCELGRINILVNMAMLLQFLAALRQGHLEQVFHIFAYLKAHNHLAMVFDKILLMVDED